MLMSEWSYINPNYAQDKRRDLRIDFLRGMVMLIMVVGHIEIFSWFNFLTWERIGVVAGAEGFVILSGLVMGKIYRRKIRQAGLHDASVSILKRAFKLYLVNIVIISSIALLTFIPDIDVTGATTFIDRGAGITYPLYAQVGTALSTNISQILLLQQGPHQVQILGLYVVLFIFAPFAFYLLEKGRVIILSGISLALYLINLIHPSMPTGAHFEYGFPALTWQLIFFHGLIFGYYEQEITLWFTGYRKVIGLTLAYILFFAFMLFAWNNPNPFMPPGTKLTWVAPDTFYHLYNLYFQKNTLGVLRLVNYVVALTVLFNVLTNFWQPINKFFGWFFVTLGQSSLYVFILHIYVLLFIYNLPIFRGLTATYTSGNIWVNTAGHTLAIAMLWIAARYKLAGKWIPS